MIEPFLFQLVSYMTLALPCVLSFAFVFLAITRNPILRFLIAVLLGWAATVVFVALVYNPVGIMTAPARGSDIEDAGMRYDNNTTSIALLVGWVPPFITAVLAFAARFLISFWRALADPENSHDHSA